MAQITLNVNTQMEATTKKTSLQLLTGLDTDILNFLADKVRKKGSVKANADFRNTIKKFGRLL